jgi:hypothetical protein
MSASGRIPRALNKATCHVTGRRLEAIAKIPNSSLGHKARSSETSEPNSIGTAQFADFISQGLRLLFGFLFSLSPMLLAVYSVRWPLAGAQSRSSSCKCFRPTPKEPCFSSRVMGQHLGRSRKYWSSVSHTASTISCLFVVINLYFTITTWSVKLLQFRQLS